MNPDRWRRIEQLYHAALEQEPARRGGFLADACREDTDLRLEVESLLAQSGSTEQLIDQTAWVKAIDFRSTRTILKPDERLGPYKILGLLGTGGMGEVYLAVDTRLDRRVAIKISQERFSGRFEREARAISALNHPNICTLYDVGPNYLVTELVEGKTLRDLLDRAPALERCLEIARQVLEALRAAHRAGIVHRDLKPQNIMVRFDGYVKVMDFGLAKRVAAADYTTRSATVVDATAPGQILGTVAYMSPEQILGQEVDQRSDLFAFGIILYEMMTGRHPWPRTSPVDTMHAILHDEPPAAEASSPCGAELSPVVQKLLAKNPAQRYPAAEAVLEALASRAAPASSAATMGSPKSLTSVAVLPFVFLTGVEESKAFSLGFADALITMLASLEDLAVLPTSVILNYPAGADPVHTCRDLGVRHVLQGNVQKLGTHWRVSIQLFDGLKQKSVLSEKHDFDMENVFDVQDEIGRRVVESLRSRFPRVAPKSRDRYTSDPEAYNEFMLGLTESYSDREETLRSAVEHLSKAVHSDPEFALAHATLSYVAMHLHFEFDPQRTWLERAEDHCRRALTLDPMLAEGHLARSFILWSSAKNFQHAEAITALEQVLAAQPNLERAHNRMSAICLHIGRLQEARLAHEQARRSNPKTRSNNLEFFYLYSGEFGLAEQAAEAWIREKPGSMYAHWFPPQPPLMSGDLDLAERRLAAALNQLPHEPLIISLQGMLHARRSQAELALQCTRRSLDSPRSFGHTHHTYYQIACTYAVLRETDRALAWLERSAETGFPCWAFYRVDPHLESLRDEPRFQRLITDLESKYTALKIERI
jgi:TolB-like protein/Tfp pilus assembly protein PilF/predicted Ser/Thr protein kinase